MELEFFPLYVSYRVFDRRAIIHLYGRSKDGQQICVLDDTFDPYFFVVPTDSSVDLDKLALQLREVTVDDAKVIEVVEEKRKLREREVTALKVVTDLPSSVPKISKAVHDWPGIKTFEYDILFVRRYLIDKGLTPCSLARARVEEVESVQKVPLFKASKVEPVSDDLPGMKVLALDIETYNPDGLRMDASRNPILMFALYGKDFRKVVTYKEVDAPDTEVVKDEKALLVRLKELIEEYGPDIITGYFSDGFDFPYLRERARKRRVKLDLGLDGSEPRATSRTTKNIDITGIVHIDIFSFVRRVIGRTLKTDSYKLDAVAEELLGERKLEVDMESLARVWDEHDRVELARFCEHNLRDSKLTFDLTSTLLPNIIELVRLTGLSMWDVNRMGFSQLVEWLIIKRASLEGEIVLSKPSVRERQRRLARRFKGAFVLEPMPGLYKDISVFDFRSLYPSIIASHNISIGTLNCECCEKSAPRVPMEGKEEFWFCQKRKGFLSGIVEDIITTRAKVKEALKKEPGNALLSARVGALKLLANSFYGYLGFAMARWYCFDCGQSVTAWGRHHIHEVIDQAKEEGFRVLYGDTDSVFLGLGKKSKEDAHRFVRKVNDKLPGLMELEFENFYPRGIFVSAKASEMGAKKRYALIDEQGKLKITGFEAVRRNWSFIAKDVQREVLTILLREGDEDKAYARVREVIADLRAHKVPVERLAIHTEMQRDIEEYSSIGPHVVAAKKMREKGIEVGPGTRVKYVVCKGKGRIRDKIKLVSDASQRDYDAEYYVKNQLLPSVDRIFSAIGISEGELERSGKQQSLGKFF